MGGLDLDAFCFNMILNELLLYLISWNPLPYLIKQRAWIGDLPPNGLVD